VDYLAQLDLLIEELTEAALKAIEIAASEAARAAILASLERETAALREAQRWRLEAETQQLAVSQAINAGRKNTVLAALIGVLGGLLVGAGGVLVISR
jgi:anti-sigma factor RsiW